MIEVVGIGEDGWDGLSRHLRDLVLEAPVVVGGKRHLAFLETPAVRGKARQGQLHLVWPSPLKPRVRAFMEDLGPQVVVLASGDPLRSGIGTTLVREFGLDAVRVHPGCSSDTLARARMGWSAEEADVVTLVGRDPVRLRPFLSPGAKLVILCSDGNGPARIARLACENGGGSAQMTAWWHLGGPNEGHRSARAREWVVDPTPDLVCVCLDVPHELHGTPGWGSAPGRPEEVFDHDGLITKRDVRASALARLRAGTDGVVWDLGAGSGAIGIEWALAAPRAAAVCVESRPERAERVERNAATLGVAHRVRVLCASNSEAVADPSLPTPDAVFLGGGLSAEVIDAAFARLRGGGRLVAHAVTVESEHLLLEAAQRHGGELVRIALEHLEPLGRFHGWRPARAVVSWSVVKPVAPTSEVSS